MPTASRGLGADLVFFLSVLLVLLALYIAADQMPLPDQDRHNLLVLHANVTYAALAIMSAKLLLRLVQAPPGEEDTE